MQMKIKEVSVSSAKKINSDCAFMVSSNKVKAAPSNINYIEVKLTQNKYFEISIDEDGDVVIRGGGDVIVRSNEENELIFQIKKSS